MISEVSVKFVTVRDSVYTSALVINLQLDHPSLKVKQNGKTKRVKTTNNTKTISLMFIFPDCNINYKSTTYYY